MSLSVERQCAEDKAAAAPADEAARATRNRLVQKAAEMEGALRALMQDDARLADLKAIAEGVAAAALKATTEESLGIGYWVDREMGTNSALPGAPRPALSTHKSARLLLTVSSTAHFHTQRRSLLSLAPRLASATMATLPSFSDRRFSTTPTTS